uniref:LOW QUALITY PROTEIN: BRCA1-associated protein n=1 Tax=Gasterosteus aculeatus aculeatus TaxID=481459 RepID=UPI001A988BB7|nr:LOW QUALITY PROTEIN: BRCA1-associated protein [Gasterosteus aculeatus aculeatus]
MSVSMVVIRLELADQSPSPRGFQYSAVEGMSQEDLREKALCVAKHTLSGKTDLERSAVLHQHIGSRSMGDMVIETFEPGPDKGGGSSEQDGEPPAVVQEGAEASQEGAEATSAAPDSPSKQLPDQISFFSGNPSVEIVHGIMHLYKTNKMTSLTEDVRRSAMVCILTVPATMTSHDLMKLLAPFNDVMEHMKIIRDSTPNQYMVLLKFCTQADADSFYTACNGRQFNSIEDAVCQMVYVERAEVIKSEERASLPVMELTELPKCTVCLERMDESVNGILTTLCNHSFHSQCLQRWDDATCPVCRYCQTPEPVEENKCFECGVQENLWICLICGHIGCGRYVSRHAYKHFEETQHTYAMQLTNHRVWDYAGDNYVHRLVASKTDGKMVQYECEGDTCHAEKIDALQLEYSYLLTSQLESQRIYWENKIVHLEKETTEEINNMKVKFKETLERCDNLERRFGEISKEKQGIEKKCTQLHTRVVKLSQELKEEQEMNRCLRANQTQLQSQLVEEERKVKETGEHKDGAIAELQEQLRDVMFYLEAQEQIEHLPPEARSEIQEGQINIGAGPVGTPPAEAPPPTSGRGRRGRGRKRK